MALFDAAAATLKAAADPKDKKSLAEAISALEVETPIGRLQWGKGPNANVVATPILGGQWVSAPPGSNYKLDFVICENSADPNVPVAGQLQAWPA
jgi:branched-chain amino acid transport system substrate-binding protein